jgi:two-component system response regulator YesN
MYRVLIADDEPIEREGLELMIQRMMPDQFLFEHAENGRVAIEKSIKFQPQIIFMDIKMPGIHGMEAIKVIQQKLPETKIIIVTAYDYFTYAKEAISLGVKEYILKPAKKEQIISLLQKLTNEIEVEHLKKLQELESIENLSHLRPLTENECTLMIMFNTVQELKFEDLSQMLDLEIKFGYAKVILLPKEVLQNEKEQRRIYECVKHYMKSIMNCLVSPIVDGYISIFIPLIPQREINIQNMEIVQEAYKTVEYIESQTGYKIVIGIGSLKQGIEGWRGSYKEAKNASLECNETMKVWQFVDQLSLDETEEEKYKLLEALKLSNVEEALFQFQLIFDKLVNQLNYNVKQSRIEFISLFNEIVQSLRNSDLEIERIHFPDVDDFSTLKKIAEHQIITIFHKISREKEFRMNHLLTLAREYIAKRYTEDISLEQVANYLNLNPFYFSKLFKKQTGETFSDYVMKIRINQAKKLMENEELNLKEICYLIGYKDPNYFSRVFKKCTNESPKAYRRKILKL